MKTSHVIIGMVLGTLAGLFCLTNAKAQTQEYDNDVTFAERNLSGPRLGVTYLPGSSSLAQKLRDKGIGTTISQFGWHFEYQVIPEGGGPSFVIQGIPLVGGVEYGTLIPSMTVAMGIRIPEGVEFGLGPNLKKRLYEEYGKATDQEVQTRLKAIFEILRNVFWAK